MKKTFVIIAIITLLGLVGGGIACVNTVIYQIDMTIYKNDNVNLNEIRALPGTTSLRISHSDYVLKILDERSKVIDTFHLPVSFTIPTSPPIKTNEAVISIALPCYDSWKSLEIYHREKLIFREKNIKLCNLNGVCDRGENYRNCYLDCPLSTKLTEEKEFENYLPYLLALFIIIPLTFLIYRKLEAKRIEKEREEFKIWKLKRELEKIKRD